MTKTGKIKFYNPTKGFGFIINEDTGKDIFVHATGVLGNKSFNPDDYVEYEESEGQRGLLAINVSKIN